MLTLDPVGLEAGVYTVMRDGDPICALDFENYPGEILPAEQTEYDALADAYEARVLAVEASRPTYSVPAAEAPICPGEGLE